MPYSTADINRARRRQQVCVGRVALGDKRSLGLSFFIRLLTQWLKKVPTSYQSQARVEVDSITEPGKHILKLTYMREQTDAEVINDLDYAVAMAQAHAEQQDAITLKHLLQKYGIPEEFRK